MKNIFENLFIFELANNHQGNLQHGLSIIRSIGKIVRDYGVNGAVKLQYRDLSTFIHPDFINDFENKNISRFLNTQLQPSEFLALVHEIKNEGLISICTPFDEVSVGLIQDHGIDVIKVASCSANDWPLLERVALVKKPVICSTGGLSLSKIDNLVSFLNHRDVRFAILHCIGIYPSPSGLIYANFINKLIQRYPLIPIGYSGHEAPDNLDIIKVVIGKGATIFERHVGIATDISPLNAYSLSPLQLEKWLDAAVTAINICGPTPEKKIHQREIDSLRNLMRGVFAKQVINLGEKLTADKVFFAIPLKENQTSSFEYHETMVATKSYSPNDPIHERRLIRSKVDIIRNIVHDIKGMLHEAKIAVGNSFKLEISHHYGLDHFRQTGAVIINVINRVYCKKLVILLPGQNHPPHYHKTKEETFQLLWGDVEIIMNDKKRIQLMPGDNCLVEPRIKHSFSTINGSILEEISTTHFKGDSVYEDEEINKIDLIERKTIIENW